MTSSASLRQSAGVIILLMGLVMSLLTVIAAPPALADGFAGTSSSDSSDTTCDDAGFATNKVNTPSIGDGSSGDWGDITRTGEQLATATINEGWTVDICIKTGAAVTVYSDASCESGAADDGVACVIGYDSSGAGGGVSHVSWGNASFTEPDPDPDVDLALTSICTATLGTQVYELYINGAQGFANLEVSDGMGVMRVTNTGTDASTVSFNVTATPLGDADLTIDPGEYSFFEVPADTTIIITDVNGDTDTKAQNGDPCDTPPAAAIDLVKTATLVDGVPLLADESGDKVLPTFEGLDAAPQTVTYEYVVTNTGDVTLTDLALVDDRLGTIDGTAGVVLEPGESETFLGTETFTVDDASELGTVTNLGTVEGDALVDEGMVTVTDSDDEMVLLELVLGEVLAPAIDLVKNALVEPDADGVKVVTYDGGDGDDETITYEYTITNTGDTELVDITLVDNVLGTILDGSEGVSLAPGGSTTVEAVHVLTEADADAGVVFNVAVTTAATPQGGEVTADDDEVVEVMEVLDEVLAADVLARTGLDTVVLGSSALLLLLVGLGTIWVDRRRRADGGQSLG